MTGGDDMLVKLWDTNTGKVLFTVDSHEGKTWNNAVVYITIIHQNVLALLASYSLIQSVEHDRCMERGLKWILIS